jgi:lipopolysaccharide/colanic/teichoic acid biosynthesis glycosyltransferase
MISASRRQKSGHARHFLDAALFRGALLRERKRADRSNQPLAVLLVTLGKDAGPSTPQGAALVAAMASIKRDTDMLGWFAAPTTLGVIMPDVPAGTAGFVEEIGARLRRAISTQIGEAVLGSITVDVLFHTPRVASKTLVDHLLVDERRPRRWAAAQAAAKRALDLTASLALLILLAPVFAVITALVKLTSPGPVFFRQERIGQGMTPFKMLKFRSMHVNASAAAHQEFVTSFIKSGTLAQEAGKKGMFKLTNDSRVTAIGGFMRKTSLDELPQLWNVVRGEMSLVGPRPPLQYEVDEYEPWHRRRLFEAKPGITGLWQVTGRSRTTFDDMVRLDLRYAKKCSVWTDIKILLATPAAVIAGKGAA